MYYRQSLNSYMALRIFSWATRGGVAKKGYLLSADRREFLRPGYHHLTSRVRQQAITASSVDQYMSGR